MVYGDPETANRFDVVSFNIYGPGTMIDSEG